MEHTVEVLVSSQCSLTLRVPHQKKIMDFDSCSVFQYMTGHFGDSFESDSSPWA